MVTTLSAELRAIRDRIKVLSESSDAEEISLLSVSLDKLSGKFSALDLAELGDAIQGDFLKEKAETLKEIEDFKENLMAKLDAYSSNSVRQEIEVLEKRVQNLQDILNKVSGKKALSALDLFYISQFGGV